jgi:CDP-glucose 4,6-dehydratase
MEKPLGKLGSCMTNAARPNPEFWMGRKVFLTGHTGFKGGWMSLWLQSMGAELTGYALPSVGEPNLFDTANIAKGMKSFCADVRDFAALNAAIQEAQPEIVIHMAAQPLVRYSYENPVETYATNVMGTVHLLEAVRNCPSVRGVVSVTSDKCYENKEWAWGYRENEPMGGYDPYSNSKGCAELVTSAYRSSYFNCANYAEHGVAIASARAGNVIGGGDWAGDRLIPDFMRAIVGGRKIQIRNPRAIRPWQHVLEPIGGYLVLAERLVTHGSDFAEGWNFGPADTDARDVEWIISRLVAEWGEGAAWFKDLSPQPHEATHLKLDCSKAHTRLNWQPSWNLDTTLSKIIAWHKAHLEGREMKEFCLKQIKEYLS